jgi:cell division protein FtsB
MRIRQSVTQSFAVLALPAVAVSVVIYFGLFGIFGPNGILAFEDASARLELAKANLLQIVDQRQQLARRVALMEQPGGDTDLIEELARNVLMDGAANQVAIARQPGNAQQ